MPLYEFRCKSCERRFETMRSYAKIDEPAACPECGSGKTMRLLSTFAAPGKSDAGGCETSASLGVPCCGGGCGLPPRR